ncbi:MAG: hypothetical protein ACTHMM_17745 [Agriterribacter sp.]
MTRPKLRVEEVKERIKDFHFPEMVFFFAIRGYYLNSMGKPGQNDRGLYDDAIFLVGPNLFIACNGNTDPSRYRPATKTKQGIATLEPGLHYFKKGKHGLLRPGGGYPAFRPANPDESLPVRRDGVEGIVKGYNINIHSGGLHETSSEGCQTIWKPQWLDFQVNGYKAMDREGQHVIPYILTVNS